MTRFVVDQAAPSEWSPRSSPSIYMKIDGNDFTSPPKDPSCHRSGDFTLRKFLMKRMSSLCQPSYTLPGDVVVSRSFLVWYYTSPTS